MDQFFKYHLLICLIKYFEVNRTRDTTCISTHICFFNIGYAAQWPNFNESSVKYKVYLQNASSVLSDLYIGFKFLK